MQIGDMTSMGRAWAGRCFCFEIFRWFTGLLRGFGGKMDLGIDDGAGTGSGVWNVIVLRGSSSV